MSDLENHEEITEQIENFGKDEVELKLGSTFSNTKDLSIDLSFRRLVYDYNKIDFSKPAEMELGQGEEKCVDYNYNVGTDGDYGSDIEFDDYERQFETSMQDEDQGEFADEFDANAEDIEDEFIEEYNGNGITNGIHDENGYEGGNSEDELMDDDAFVEVENPLQPSALGVTNVLDEEIIKNDTESSGTSSGSSSSSVSGSESGDDDGSDSTGSELESDLDLKNLEADLEAQLTEAPNDDIVKTNGVNRKTNPSSGRPGGPISLTELFGGT
ncbi:18585_t:CDS:2, partial [Racocetra fulgida]